MDVISTSAFTVNYANNLGKWSHFRRECSRRTGISLLVWEFCIRVIDHVVPHDYFLFRFEFFEDLQLLSVFGVGMKTVCTVTADVF